MNPDHNNDGLSLTVNSLPCIICVAFANPSDRAFDMQHEGGSLLPRYNF